MPLIEPFLPSTTIAYFSMEMALRPEMHSYSGGLGILAGDTARASAELELPMVFVTLSSRGGYLRQEIDHEGRQVDRPDAWRLEDWARPLDVMVALPIEGRSVWIRPWLYTLTTPLASPLGRRVPVLLLDTYLEQNAPEDRLITDRLYGGDTRHRLKQEIVLGLGGARCLEALGFRIGTYHMNEGHAAILTLHLLRRFRRSGGNGRSLTSLQRYDAEKVRELCVFTTHTPVEAGHDRFDYAEVERTLGSHLVEIETIKAIAGEEDLNMTRLALNLSGYINGVARRHAETTRRMFPGYRIEAITNGVHLGTWTHPAVARLLDALVPSWQQEPELLARAEQLDDTALWQARDEAKADLLRQIVRVSGQHLDPGLPILGFARRMTGYKRLDLLFHDFARLRAIAQRWPFQVVIAGKAHPRDLYGKEVIAEIHRHIRALEGDIPIVFLPNYDMAMARWLVAGVDLWLNTPLPPLEASGTSGMKVALNGGLNVSVLDGWWLEACIEDVTGWAIGGDGLVGASPAALDEAENTRSCAAALHDKLENRILPLYHEDRGQWTWMMKQSIGNIGSFFNARRMMRSYASEAYLR